MQLLVACCLSDVLRIYAPEAPYTKAALKDMFGLFIQQLQVIEQTEDERYLLAFHLLENLARCKSFIIMLDLPHVDDMLASLYRSFFDVIHEEHNNLVETNMLDVLMTCVEESSMGVPAPVRDAILERLIEPLKSEKPAGHRLACKLVERDAEYLQSSITRYISDVINRASDSELADPEDMHKIVLALGEVAPQILTFVLPQFKEILQTEDVQERLQLVHLMGSIFSTSDSSFPLQFSSIFSEFLGRLKDVEIDIRRHLLEYTKLIILSRSSAEDEVVKITRSTLPTTTASDSPCHKDAMLTRLMDPEDSVRKKAVEAVCEVAMERPDAVNADTIEAVRQRLRDKKVP